MLKIQKLDLTRLLGQTIKWNKVACLGKHDFSEARKELQWKCVVEEINELIEAVQTDDDVEMLDALCDMLFVGIYGLYLETDTKLSITDLVMSFDKMELFENETIINETLLSNFVTEFPELIKTDLLDRGAKYALICTAVLGAGLVLDVDFKGAYENVVNSNFTKFPLTDDVAVGAELEWFNTLSKYDDVCVEEFDGHFIFRCNGGEGKIVKPRVFCEPKLEQFING